jgi:hypothetical protein
MMSANGFRIGEKSPESDLPSVRRKAPRHADKSRGWAQGLLQVAPSRSPFQTRGISYQQSGKLMGETVRRSPAGVALNFASRLIRPAIITGAMAALIAATDTPTVTPLGCAITWTRTGGVWIYEPDCSHQSPPSQPSPNGPPPNPGTPPNPPPTP